MEVQRSQEALFEETVDLTGLGQRSPWHDVSWRMQRRVRSVAVKVDSRRRKVVFWMLRLVEADLQTGGRRSREFTRRAEEQLQRLIGSRFQAKRLPICATEQLTQLSNKARHGKGCVSRNYRSNQR